MDRPLQSENTWTVASGRAPQQQARDPTGARGYRGSRKRTDLGKRQGQSGLNLPHQTPCAALKSRYAGEVVGARSRDPSRVTRGAGRKKMVAAARCVILLSFPSGAGAVCAESRDR